MTTLYKLTDAGMRTYHGYQWALGEERTAPGGGDLCTAAWLHAYTDPLLAVLLDPIGGAYTQGAYTQRSGARLFEAEGVVEATDHGLKVGCTRLRLRWELTLPPVTSAQRVRFGILCALAGCHEPQWIAWAQAWLSGNDRSQAEAASAAAWAASAAARAAAEAEAAAWAASAAAEGAADGSLDLVALARQALEGA